MRPDHAFFPGLTVFTPDNIIPLYTVNLGSHDTVKKPPSIKGTIPFLFSDRSIFPPVYSGWNVIRVTSYRPMSNRLLSRLLKFSAHQLFPNASSSVYVDSSMMFGPSFRDILLSSLSSELVLFRHPSRSTVQEEIDACSASRKITSAEAHAAKDYFNSYLLSWDHTLFATGFIGRSHKSTRLNNAMHTLSSLMTELCLRDQISLPPLLHSHSIAPLVIDDSIYCNKYISATPHSGDPLMHKIKYALSGFFKYPFSHASASPAF
jgi:hypothetical protein